MSVGAAFDARIDDARGNGARDRAEKAPALIAELVAVLGEGQMFPAINCGSSDRRTILVVHKSHRHAAMS